MMMMTMMHRVAWNYSNSCSQNPLKHKTSYKTTEKRERELYKKKSDGDRCFVVCVFPIQEFKLSILLVLLFYKLYIL